MFNRIYLKFLRWRGWPKSRRLLLPSYGAPEKKEIRRALADHAGFQELMAYMETVKATYEQHPPSATHAGRNGLDGILQYHTECVRNEEAIFWIGFLQNAVRRTGAMPNLTPFERPAQESWDA